MNPKLNAFERWCVRSNIKRIEEEGFDADDVVAQIHANGYPRVASVVQAYIETVRAANALGLTCREQVAEPRRR